MLEANVTQRLEQVLQRMALACDRAGRAPESVRLVAVSKRIDPSLVLEACRAGQWEFGENRLPDAVLRQQEMAALLQASGLEPARLRWHFIGHLQSRKAPAASGRFSLLHGVDSLKLARKLNALAIAENRQERILLEVNISREPQKYGFDPDRTLEVVQEILLLKGLALAGMMTMAPHGAKPKILHQTFAGLRRLNEETQRQTGLALPQLSMGMSNDFEEAIAEGATLVRVGSAIFGPRS